MALRWAGQLNHATPGHRSYRGSVEVKLLGEFEVVRGGVAIPVRGAKLSTADYFRLSRRFVRATDQAVVNAGGVVGRHLGDGVTAFFLAETLGTESAAAPAAIEATRSLRAAGSDLAIRSGLDPEDFILRFGLHWGATLYVGLIKSVARSEVTAMGDEVNEAARIEAGASGGLARASKALIERLSRRDSAELELDHVAYTPLGDLSTATQKARRDAPSISVCEI